MNMNSKIKRMFRVRMSQFYKRWKKHLPDPESLDFHFLEIVYFLGHLDSQSDGVSLSLNEVADLSNEEIGKRIDEMDDGLMNEDGLMDGLMDESHYETEDESHYETEDESHYETEDEDEDEDEVN